MDVILLLLMWINETRLKIVSGWSYPAPAPPYVTTDKFDRETVERMQNALLDAFEDPSLLDCREILLLKKIEISSATSYQRIHDEFRHNLRAI